ncbi:oxidoreductase [Marivirga tractuosa]|uniref:Short-chain dehydrogenase/reductase SDR n=1 Tax=Marivirga tractuosa (strain ATCC 23168 / DSM 4126 / NBRC 15989 / NCIMB 1408 / VKM B-1430 / H-43) TaxID=643867 RepID=E4TRD9_MARTH|nr:SDR family oxidoreductase [Marivirga tractuosa]ADR20673.1 short-chain dehydrogenase/reductase SDR [Marivirga tractuosa DSM 4126]BDD14877.1 oxidoreductase [Marivirga tractuosa]
MSFKDKNILIVGASSGIGLSLAKKLKKEGANLILASRNKPDLSGDFHYIQLDVLDMKDELKQLPDTLHGLAYCPGSINLKPFQSIKENDYINDFRLNTVGAAMVIQQSLKALKNAKGASVVLFSTVAANTGLSFHASIASAKGALQGFGLSIAAELASKQIRVNMVAPSLTDTPLAENLLSNDEKKEASNKRHPIGRFGKPEDISNAACFLLDSENSWITGQIIGVDGGMERIRNI